MTASLHQPTQQRADRIDPRGMRFAAVITSVVLAAALLFADTRAGLVIITVQLVVFGIGAAFGVRMSPYAVLFRRVIRPRISPPAETEDARPPRFAQSVGLAFAVVAVVALALGATLVGQIAIAAALAAALLNAVFNFCLGCEMYLLLLRFSPRAAGSPVAS